MGIIPVGHSLPHYHSQLADHSLGQDNLAWATPETLADWGYQAMHGSVAIGKKLTEAYYGKKITYSYYSGCSTGGRQGLKEVQISADSFDGVLIGAAAWAVSSLMPWVCRIGSSNLPTDGANHIDLDQFATLAAFALKNCAHLDGNNDSIISLPEQCQLDFSQIQCADPNNTDGCLLPEQIKTAQGIYNNAYNSEGEFLFPGFDVGSEDQWYVYEAYGDEADFDSRYPRQWLYDDPNWNYTLYNDSMFDDSWRLNPGNATADNFDISLFHDRGGKVLMYQGLADGLIPPRSSDIYYNETVKAVSGNIDTWFRYFHVPGMQHCFGTPSEVNAPWMFAAPGQATALLQTYGFGNGYGVPNLPASASHDALLALMDWVEKGKAPDSIMATAWNPSGTVNRTRPLCPYPKQAVYSGAGSQDSSSNWSCK